MALRLFMWIENFNFGEICFAELFNAEEEEY
jgi:hypothetical protein